MVQKEKQGGGEEEDEEDKSEIGQILQSAWVRRHAILFERMIVFCSVESTGDQKTYRYLEEFPLNKVVVHDETTEEDAADDDDDDDDDDPVLAAEQLLWTLSVEHLGNKFAYKLKHQERQMKRQWYETAYGLNQRLRPLFFKKLLYRKLLTLIFAEPKVLGELVMRINRSMVCFFIHFFFSFFFSHSFSRLFSHFSLPSTIPQLRQQANSVIDLICTKFFDSMDTNNLAEYYLLKFVKSIIAAEISSLKNLDDFLMGDSITLKVVSIFFQRSESMEYLRKLLTPVLADLLHQDSFPTEHVSEPPITLKTMFKRNNSNESLPSIASKQSTSNPSLGSSGASIISTEDGIPFLLHSFLRPSLTALLPR